MSYRPVIIGYDVTYNELEIQLGNGIRYTYYSVSPYQYNRLRVLLNHNNYKAFFKHLQPHSDISYHHSLKGYVNVISTLD